MKLHAPNGLKTGDVLICYGTGFVSGVISWLTPRLRFWRKAPSHVAIVAIHDDAIHVHESTTLGKLRCKFAGEARRGIQAHLFSDWLAAFDGTVYLRRLKVPMPRPGECVRYLLDLHQRKVGYSVRAALHSASPVNNSATGLPMFCSSVVGFALQKGGSVGTHINCNELHPHDIDTLPCVAGRELLKG